MQLLPFVAGFLMAFVASMPPIGPVAVILLQRGMSGRSREGVAIGLGAALAEAIYCALALAGLSALMERYPVIEMVSRVAGVALLLGLGVHFTRFVAKEPTEQAPPAASLHGPFLVGFGIAAANPVLILTWSAAAATFLAMAHIHLTWGEATLFVVGAFLGMFSWYRLFLWGLERHREKIALRAAQWAVRAGGVALIVMAVWGAYAVLRSGLHPEG